MIQHMWSRTAQLVCFSPHMQVLLVSMAAVPPMEWSLLQREVFSLLLPAHLSSNSPVSQASAYASLKLAGVCNMSHSPPCHVTFPVDALSRNSKKRSCFIPEVKPQLSSGHV